MMNSVVFIVYLLSAISMRCNQNILKQVATRTKAAIGKREGKIDNLTRLEVIQVEERKIAEDKKELAVLEEEKKQKLAKKKAAEVSKWLCIDNTLPLSRAASCAIKKIMNNEMVGTKEDNT